MKQLRVTLSAEELMQQRKAPKQATQQFFDKEAAKEQAGKISRELSNFFRFKNFTEKRLAIEEQAEEASTMKLDPMPKLDPPVPPAPVSGGESSVAPDPRRKKKKPGKPDARLVKVDTQRMRDKARLRQRIIEAQIRRKHRVVQGIVAPPRGIIQGEAIGQLPSKYRGITVD